VIGTATFCVFGDNRQGAGDLPRWRKVKDGLAYADGRVYFGSYDSHVYAVNAVTGKLV